MENTNRHIAYSALLIASVLPSSSIMADVNRIYLEKDGFIHFDSEDADIVSDWVLGTQIDGFGGAGYLEWTGPNFFSENNAGSGTIAYHFRVETAGNYELRWRSRIAKGDSNTESNDSWARLDTGSNVSGEEPLHGWTKVYMGESDVWSWSSRTVDEVARPVRQFFSVGDHTVEISGRSNGHAIDRIALYRYEDVSFDSGLNGTLPLSLIAQGDGTIIDPNPAFIPEPEVVLSDRINVVPIDLNTSAVDTAMCVANTLTLPAIDTASLNILNTTLSNDSGVLSLEPNAQSLLMSFDLSRLPPISAARLDYSTGDSISNGSLDFYLGSHSDWSSSNTTAAPDAMVLIAESQGGWEATARYASELNSVLLPGELTTLILQLRANSDRLKIDLNALSTPTLVLSGNNEFCADWQANMVEQEQTTTDTEESGDITPRSKGGAIDHWLGLILLTGYLRNILLRKRIGAAQ